MSVQASKIVNGDSASYWQAAREGRLEFQRCGSCGHVQFPPRVQCAECWSDAIEPLAASGKGAIESITVVHRAPLKSFRDKVPYAIVAIASDEGPRIISNLVGDGALEAKIGDRVRVCFEENADGDVLPQFQLSAD